MKCWNDYQVFISIWKRIITLGKKQFCNLSNKLEKISLLWEYQSLWLLHETIPALSWFWCLLVLHKGTSEVKVSPVCLITNVNKFKWSLSHRLTWVSTEVEQIFHHMHVQGCITLQIGNPAKWNKQKHLRYIYTWCCSTEICGKAVETPHYLTEQLPLTPTYTPPTKKKEKKKRCLQAFRKFWLTLKFSHTE